ncbi:MAG TPA: esterase-like activity of phytase family protein [Thauera sp.]|nr:esterase-like activity of phytase family protein [Thauera sp.]
MNAKLTALPTLALSLALLSPAALAQTPAASATPTPAPDAEALVVAASLRVVGATIDGERIAELSGLAWDADAQRLYAISDHGVLFRFAVTLGANGQLEVEPLAAGRLAPPPGSNGVDAEGLALTHAADGIRGNSELLVATEGQPRVIRYTLAGEALETLALPGGLDDPERFRRSNAMLEAVALHPEHGLLVAAEAPLEGEAAGQHRVFAAGRSWSFPSYPARNARLKGMDVMDDGRLLVLERAETGKGKGKALVVVLREVDLASCAEGATCPVRDLALLDRADEADNFEGLTDLGDGRVMIVSDDRGKSGRGTTFTVLQRRSATD